MIPLRVYGLSKSIIFCIVRSRNALITCAGLGVVVAGVLVITARVAAYLSSPSRICERMERADLAIGELEVVFDKLCKKKDGPAIMFAGLGRRGKHYDSNLLWAMWHVSESDEARFGPRIVEACRRRLAEQPELIQLFFDEEKWWICTRCLCAEDLSAPECIPFLIRFRSDLFEKMRTTRLTRFVWLLRIRAMYNQQRNSANINWSDIDVRWLEAGVWLKEVAPYTVFDREQGCYVIDQLALARQVPVRADQQDCSNPSK